MTATTIQIHPKYQRLWTAKTRYVLLTGGRGSAKSFAASTWACYNLTNKDNWKILYTRYTLQSAEISIIPEFLEKIGLLNMEAAVNATKTVIDCPARNGSIIFSGIKTSSGNQTAKLKSIPGLNVFVVDEAEEFVSEHDFNVIDDSIRMPGVQNIVVLIMNPQDIEHWIWKRWFEKSHHMIEIDGHQIPISTHPDITHIHTTYLDNIKNLNPDYLKKIEKLRQTDPEAYAHRYLGKWLEKKEGVIYPNWIEGEFDESLPYGYGLDFGFYPNPDGMCKVAVDIARKRVYLKECMYATQQSNELIKSRVLDIAGHDSLVVADSNDPRTIDTIAYAGVNIQKVDKYPGCVVDRIRILNEYTWIITPESYNAKMEFNNYIWNDKKASIPLDKNNHIIKAAEYIATRLLQGSDILAGNY